MKQDPMLLEDVVKAAEKLPFGEIPAGETITEVHDTLLNQKRKVVFRKRELMRDGKNETFWVTFGIIAVKAKEVKPCGEGGEASPGNDS